MNERIKYLRKFLRLSQDDFGDKIGIRGASVSLIENGKRNVSNQVVTSICREFGINESWLKFGKGEMYSEMSKAEKASKLVGSVLGSTEDEFILNTFIALGQATPTEWEVIKNFVNRIKGE